jgi:hypothetical protein
LFIKCSSALAKSEYITPKPVNIQTLIWGEKKLIIQWI